MSTRMLIDARHPEETRVAVLKGNRIEEFDFDSADRKQIKGNIYLAKVTRVEPSLQAAFVDFGGNRHGFLAFNEIHPDYYQIPTQDREALLAEEAAAAEEEAALRAQEEDGNGDSDSYNGDDEGDDSETLAHDLAGEDGVEEVDTSDKNDVATIEGGNVGDDSSGNEIEDDLDSDDEDQDDSDDAGGNRRRGRRQGRARSKQAEELRARRMALRRRYKIQDVIQRRQVLLVQVVKEERGNKGAALTTYLSLAGRYCVLMPNSGHGGGISRKISSVSDRKRLKQIIAELQLPRSMGCIVRTAGLSRTKTEIKRDFDYLARLWDEIRERTLGSTAPILIHSDSDLIKRAIRDIYNRDIEEVVVEGEEGYKGAKQFMKLLMPSHARRVKQYADPVPLFQRYGAEDQLSAMYDPMVQLKSGGYLVINPTEALVSIDINSGRSTKEHGIEQTALNTNLEAAREIARQLRLRDMAGLIVIDFIDMEYSSNIRKIEKAMKEALKNDRARIQVGRISSFGLMEMSRQRLRTGVLEATTRACPHCDGTGLVRTASSAGLSALRLIEDEAAKGKGSVITLYASTEAAVYLLNAKRADLAEIEHRYGVTVEVMPEGEEEGAKMRIASSGPRPEKVPVFEPLVQEDEEDDYEEDEDQEQDSSADNEDDGEPRRKRRRRRGGRGRRASGHSGDLNADTDEDTPQVANQVGENDEEDVPRKKRRRRGGRGRRKTSDDQNQTVVEDGSDTVSAQLESDIAIVAEPDGAPKSAAVESENDEQAALPETPDDAETGEEKPKPKRRSRKKPEAKKEKSETTTEPIADSPVELATVEGPKDKPKRTRRKKTPTPAEAPAETAPEAIDEAETIPDAEKQTGPANDANGDITAPGEEDDGPRRGWWQKTFGN